MQTAEQIAAKLTKTETVCLMKHPRTLEWHRINHAADRQGGLWRNHLRRMKFKQLGLIEHRINAGAEYRFTPLGIAVRCVILSGDAK